MALTGKQYIGINVANFVSSPLSILGSATIIFLIVRRYCRSRRFKRDGPNHHHPHQGQHTETQQSRAVFPLRLYDCIVFLLSLGDLILSTSNLVQSFAVPRGTEGAYWAVGNTQTCSTIGFIAFYASQWVAGLNCFLAIYFLMSVRYGWKDQDFTRKLKIVALCLVIILPGATSTFAAYHQVYNFNTNTYICLIGDYPDGCQYNDDLKCERGQRAELVGYVVVIVILVFSLTGFACTFMVYWTVRTKIRRSLRHSRGWFVMDRVSNTNGTTTNNDNQNGRSRGLRSIYNRDTSYSNRLTPLQEERIQQTAWQAVFYSIAYFNIFFWPFTAQINHQVNNGEPGDQIQEPLWYIILLVTWLFYPIQGFLNAMIYLRPDVSRWKKLNPSCSIFWILKQTVCYGREPFQLSRVTGSGNQQQHQDHQTEEELAEEQEDDFAQEQEEEMQDAGVRRDVSHSGSSP